MQLKSDDEAREIIFEEQVEGEIEVTSKTKLNPKVV